jgi:tetratricopeptide (TPR) repeat protein
VLSLVSVPAGAGQAARAADGQSAVVELRIYDGFGGPVLSAEAFFVDVGHVVTDRRLLRSAARAAVRLGSREYPVTAVLADDPAVNLMLLAVDLPDGGPVPIRLASRPTQEGDRVLLLPRTGVPDADCSGEVSGIHVLPRFGSVLLTTILTTAPPGTPLVDGHGELVGVSSRLTLDGGSDAFFIPAARLHALTPVRPSTVSEWASAAPAASGETDAATYAEAMRLSLEHRFDAALPRFERVLEENDQDADAQAAVGVCLEEMGRREEAAAAYRLAATLDPDNARTWYRLGVVASDLQRWNEAVEAFTRVSRLAPGDAFTHYNLGVAYGNLGRTREEVDAYTRTIRLDPEQPAAYNNLGVAYIGLKRFADAVVALSRAVRLAPGNADAQANLGVALADAGRSDDSVQALREAVRLAPGSVKAHYALGVVLATIGDKAGAAHEQQVLERLDKERAQLLARQIASAAIKGPGR